MIQANQAGMDATELVDLEFTIEISVPCESSLVDPCQLWAFEVGCGKVKERRNSNDRHISN
jgi:hypothetical protein